MGNLISRRTFLAGMATAAACAGFATTETIQKLSSRKSSKLRLSVLTDEITSDFELACRIAREEFNLDYVELRELWGKNILKMNDDEVQKAKAVLDKFGLKVTAIAGPLFKMDWPGAPISKFSSTPRDAHGGAFAMEEQDKVLTREIELARIFDTKHIRCFDFWRLDDVAPHREAINKKLLEAAEKAGKAGLVLVLENEHACNTATGAESAKTLAAVNHPAFKLIWDPGNAFFAKENPFPEGYKQVPVDRIAHMHVKDARKKSDGTPEFMPVGKGVIDYVGNFKAMLADGYSGPVTLETHYKANGSKEAGTRESMAGMFKALEAAGAFKD